MALRTDALTLAHLRSAGGGFLAMRRWRHRTHLAGLLVALAAAGCQRAAETPQAHDAEVMLVDAGGRTVRLDAPARRVVSLLPSFTEILFAIGAGDRLVGRTTWCDYPAAARDVPNVGDGMPPSVEAVAARHPDLVVLYHSGPNVTAARQLESLHIPAVLVELDLLEHLGPATRALGLLTGRTAAADTLARELERIAARKPPPAVTSIAFIVWDNPPIVIGGGSYLDRLAALAGARNVFHDIAAPSAQVALETITRRDPRFIAVLGDSGVEPAFVARPEWQAVRAVRARRWIPLAGSLFGRPGPRAGLAVRDLEARLGTAP